MSPQRPRSPVAVHTSLDRGRLTVILLLLGGVLAACGPNTQPLDPELNASPVAPLEEATAPAADVEVLVPTQGTPAEEPVEVTIEQLATNPAMYLGQQVIITGSPTEVFGPRSFALGATQQPGADNTLVVGSEEGVIPSQLAPNAALTDQVRVIGTVRQFDQSELEEQLGFQFPAALTEGFTGGTAIVAEQVEVIEGAAVEPEATTEVMEPQPTAPSSAAAGAAEIPEAARGDFPFVSVGQIDVDPEAFFGQRVTAWGEVDEQLGLNTFRVDEGNILDVAGELLVVVPEGAPRPDNLQNETSIAITGMVQQFVAADFERDYGLLFDDPGIEAEFESRPVLIADIVYTRASVSDVDDDAEAYIGNRVTVLGDITEQLDARTFRLDDPALLGGDDLLVFLSDSAMAANVGDEVFVTGQVREFNRDALGAEYGYAWDDTAFDGFAESTIIIAENVQVTGQADSAADLFGGAAARGDRYGAEQIGISDIADNPEAYIGQQVNVNGEVSEVLGPNVLRMDEDNWLDIGDDVLVVLPDGVARPETLEDETNIVIEGTVRTFVLAEFERDYDFFTDTELYAEFENRPAIVADMLWLQASLSDVDDNPDAYMGNRVTVFGEASELYGTNGFRLEDPGFLAGDDVLVLMRDGAMSVAEDGRYYVTGTVQRFNLTDAEAELGYELDEGLFTDWTDRTVIIADSVQARGR